MNTGRESDSMSARRTAGYIVLVVIGLLLGLVAGLIIGLSTGLIAFVC